jgi:hypothetical protein
MCEARKIEVQRGIMCEAREIEVQRGKMSEAHKIEVQRVTTREGDPKSTHRRTRQRRGRCGRRKGVGGGARTCARPRCVTAPPWKADPAGVAPPAPKESRRISCARNRRGPHLACSILRCNGAAPRRRRVGGATPGAGAGEPTRARSGTGGVERRGAGAPGARDAGDLGGARGERGEVLLRLRQVPQHARRVPCRAVTQGPRSRGGHAAVTRWSRGGHAAVTRWSRGSAAAWGSGRTHPRGGRSRRGAWPWRTRPPPPPPARVTPAAPRARKQPARRNEHHGETGISSSSSSSSSTTTTTTTSSNAPRLSEAALAGGEEAGVAAERRGARALLPSTRCAGS